MMFNNKYKSLIKKYGKFYLFIFFFEATVNFISPSIHIQFNLNIRIRD